MEFEWDAEKAASNLDKHGVGFTEAMTVFGDPFKVTIPDQRTAETRFVSIGTSGTGRLLVAVYTERGNRIRMISAREATPKRDSMNQKANIESDQDMLPEYDFSAGVRGKHHEAYKAGTNVVFLDADVAKAFPDSASVNRALRLLLDLAKDTARH